MAIEGGELPLTKDKQRILVVEDYEPNILVVTYFLTELGYEYETAYNGREAIDKFGRSAYATVLMDIQLPGIDGIEAIRQIRILEKERGITRTPIVVMTGRATEDDKFLCRKSGADNLLAKPFKKVELKNILEDVIKPVRNL